MLELRGITWDNFQDVMNLAIPDSQKAFVRPIPVFLAQSYVNLREGYQDESLAVYDNETLIGYAKIVFVPAGEDVYAMPMDSFMIDALIIDGAHQGKGHGKAAFKALMEYAKTSMDHGESPFSLVIFDDNIRAVGLALGHGFSFLKRRSGERPMSVYIKTDV